MNKKFAEAWKYLNRCTYFTKPYYNSDEGFITFANEFQDSLRIDITKKYVYLECGSWSMDINLWFHDYTLNIRESTFEKAIIALYNKVYNRCGEDYTDDYFHIKDTENIKDCFVKKDNGNCAFVSGSVTSYWDKEKLFEKIKSFS